MTESTINIRPGVRMLELFASLPYREWYAIGEFVDNAIQSYNANQDRLQRVHGSDFVLEIDIVIEQDDGGRITVSDNAAGIAGSDWERAMRVAVPPDDTKGLSQFGVGMKAAACWFARNWSVHSAALGEEVSRRVDIDVARTVASESEDVILTETLKSPEAHGTVIAMTSLRRKPWGAGIRRIKDHLSSIYREFLRDGDVVIRYNGEPIVFESPPVLDASFWETPDSEPVHWQREFSFTLISGRPVNGWVAIRKGGKQKEAGLALKYRRKVIVGAGDERYKPESIFGQGNTFRSQRLFGEIDVSAFDVSHTKDSLLWGDEEDEVVAELLKLLRSEEFPVLSQAENYRSQKPDPVPPRQLESAGERIRRALVDLKPPEQVIPVVQRKQVSSPSFLDERGVDYESDYETVIDGQPLFVRVQLVREPNDRRWLWHVEGASDQARMRIVVNRSHPFMRKFGEAPVQDLEAVWMIGVAIVLGAKQGSLRGARMTNLVVEGVNEYVRRLSS